MEFFNTKISGSGKFNPEKIMTNEDLTKMVDTSDEWIVQRTGIKERRIADLDKGEYPSGMAYYAAKDAIEKAGLEPNDIDMILFSITLPDMLFPSTASQLQDKLGITTHCACLDINAACTGWVYGLTLGNSLIQTGAYKNVLVVGTEMTSAFNNWEDRNSCILFGDGSGAVVLSRAEATEECAIVDSVLSCDSSKADTLILYKGGSKAPITHEVLNNKEQYVTMDGQVVFKNAVKTMAKHCATLLKRNNLTTNDIDWFIPHQANLRIIETTAKLLNYPMEKVICNVEKYANTSSASIPIALTEAINDGRIKRGQTLLFAAFGAGLTSGAVLIKF
ncbi:MAG: ketoacyl-ACP synthase III [Bacteriovoracaceae bacterium]|jgi:3-oxoacyl-[acyl-carrier-protein] synthase-3|nr:ketoacyl-ACP synthase III [Bacteriovoracaceae bacterium]